MTGIDTKQLGIYAPKDGESIRLSQEAGKVLAESIFQYRQIFYGLRKVAWENRDKKAVFFEALEKGELEQFKLAPGVREKDGSYTKGEWDTDRLNLYLWNRFVERFNEAFGIDRIGELKTIKEVATLTRQLLEAALDNWGGAILGKKLEVDVKPLSIGAGVKHCNFDYNDDINIKGDFLPDNRCIVISSRHVEFEVIVEQWKSPTSWKGQVSFDTWSKPVTMSSKTATIVSKMFELASRINIGIKEFMNNPEGFLGLETAAARNRNIQLIKERLLEINKVEYEKRKSTTESEESKLQRAMDKHAQSKQRLETTMQDKSSSAMERLRDIQFGLEAEEDVREASLDLEAARERQQQSKVEQSKYEKMAGELKVYRVDPATLNKPKSRKAREQEAAAWLAANPEFAKDPDEQLNLETIDSKKLEAAQTNELPM